MDEKKLLKAQEELKAKLQEIAVSSANANVYEFARIANMPYDAEIPFPEVIEKVCKTARVEKGEDYEYFTISPETKTVTTISNGSITQQNVTPDSENDLTFNSYSTLAYNVYVEKLLEAKYDPIKVKTDTAMKSCDYKETKDVLDLLITAAENRSNIFTLDSGDSALDFEKLVEMVEALAKYGTKLVLIAGANIVKDLKLLDYNDNKQREVSPAKAGIDEVIYVRAYNYTHSGSQTILDADKAILVATSDAADERPIHFVRRKVADLTSVNGGTKERIVVAAGPRIPVGSNPKWAYEIAAMEQYGAVVVNEYACAVFKRASSYS